MAGTVLGKRARSGADITAASPSWTRQGNDNGFRATPSVNTRPKRRVAVNEPSDENQNPFLTRISSASKGEACELDEAELPQSKKTRTSARTTSARTRLQEQRTATSPTKIDAHFKAVKAGVEVYQEDKENAPTPRTPRQRDALSKKVSITPRHRVLVAGAQRTPKTPRTPASPFNGGTVVYNEARRLFSRCTAPGRLVGREEERGELSAFIERCIESTETGCLYVSGPPGTGKSALVNEVTERYQEMTNVKLSVVNCMSVRNAKDLSSKLAEDLSLQDDAGFSYLKTCFMRSGEAKDDRTYLVILDEVDRLVDLDLALLYNLFEWSLAPTSRLILIGIANALDLTDRFLPRLKSRNLKPKLLPFMPYTSTQIAEVLTGKLKTLSPPDSLTIPFIHPAAISLCAKKVAAQTGDLRKAFDICRRAVDLVEQETRAKDIEAAVIHQQDSPFKTPLMENINLSSPSTPRSPSKGIRPTGLQAMPIYTIETAPRASIAHVARVTSLVFGNGTIQRLSTLNLQQKAVLCALSALEKRKRDQQLEKTMFATPSKRTAIAPSVKETFEAYSILCKRENLLTALSASEFRDVVSGLETLGLLSVIEGNGRGMAVPLTPRRTPSRKGRAAGGFGVGAAMIGDEKRIAGVVGEKELMGCLDGVGGELLRDILLEGAALV